MIKSALVCGFASVHSDLDEVTLDLSASFQALRPSVVSEKPSLTKNRNSMRFAPGTPDGSGHKKKPREAFLLELKLKGRRPTR